MAQASSNRSPSSDRDDFFRNTTLDSPQGHHIEMGAIFKTVESVDSKLGSKLGSKGRTLKPAPLLGNQVLLED